MMRHLPVRKLVLVLFCVSGASTLLYEIIWSRYFVSVFGVTLYATSVVLAAFMGGLGLGSYLFGRTAECCQKPLRAYGYLEIGIGLYALLINTITTKATTARTLLG